MNLQLAEIALVVGMATNMQADVDHKDLVCLARNIYHEARGEDREGQIAVAYTTLNRVESPRFPDDICAVVTEDRGPGAHDCQFTWTCDGRSDTPKDLEAYQLAVKLAIRTMTGEEANPAPGATHYYAPAKVSPGWAPKMVEIAVIGDHRFMLED